MSEFKEWWDSLSKPEQRLFAMIFFIMEACDYAYKNPDSEWGKLMWNGLR